MVKINWGVANYAFKYCLQDNRIYLQYMFYLIDLPLDKMPGILQTTSSNACSWMKSFSNSIRITLKFVPKGSIESKSVLVQIMARRWTCDKPLPEAMLTQFTDAYIYVLGGRWRWVNLGRSTGLVDTLNHVHMTFVNLVFLRSLSIGIGFGYVISYFYLSAFQASIVVMVWAAGRVAGQAAARFAEPISL